MRNFLPLVRREFLEGRNGFLVTPITISGLVLVFVLLGALGFTTIHLDGDFEHHGNLAGMLDLLDMKAEEGEVTARKRDVALAGFLIITSTVAALALPFVMFFSLLGALYEERRDKSILFWKSMPVSDWEEVSAKLFTSTVGATGSYIGVALAMHAVLLVLLSAIAILQGGDASSLWQIPLIISAWVKLIPIILLHYLWVLPHFAWLLLVSSAVQRLPVLFAILPYVVIRIVESLFFDSEAVSTWATRHMGGWLGELSEATERFQLEDRGEELARLVDVDVSALVGGSLVHPSFWLGLVIAGLFLYGAVFMRRRAI